jgi:Flp pilus assembly CpaE family ATPase
MRETIEENYTCVIEKQKIGVVGMSRGAGATLVATSLAKLLSYRDDRKVTLLEVCDNVCNKRSLLYDAIGFDKRFKTREFARLYSEIKQGGNVRGKTNPDDRINWGLITPEDIEDGIQLTPIEAVRLINNISGDLIICDISECANIEDYLIDMDVVVFVIDPMPSAMIRGYPFLKEVKRFEHRGKKVIWVVNKYNAGIHKRDMQNFLKLKECYKIPFIDAEHFYGAEYNCKIPYEMTGIRDGVREPIEKIIAKELVLC